MIVAKLLILESGIEVESGFELSAKTGEEIVVVAGVYPYSLALKGVSPLPHFFEPDYPLEQYLRDIL